MIFAPSPDDLAWLLLLYLVAPVAWIVGMIRIGARPARRLRWTLVVAGFYVAFAVASHTGGYVFTLQVLDVQRRPLPGVVVSYFTHPASDRIGRFAAPLKGQVATDAAGRITLRPNHAHSLSGTIRDPRFQYAAFEFAAAGKRYGHQLYPEASENDAEGGFHYLNPPGPPPTTGQFHGTWIIEPEAQHSIVVCLKPK